MEVPRSWLFARPGSTPRKFIKGVFCNATLVIRDPSFRVLDRGEAGDHGRVGSRHDNFDAIGHVVLRKDPVGCAGMRVFICHQRYMVFPWKECHQPSPHTYQWPPLGELHANWDEVIEIEATGRSQPSALSLSLAALAVYTLAVFLAFRFGGSGTDPGCSQPSAQYRLDWKNGGAQCLHMHSPLQLPPLKARAMTWHRASRRFEFE